MARPGDRQAWSRLSAPSTSSALPSTWIVAMVQVSSLSRPRADVANGIRVLLCAGNGVRDKGQWSMTNLPRRGPVAGRAGLNIHRLRPGLERVARAGDACFEFRAEILDRAAQGLDGARCVGAEGLAGAEQGAQLLQGLDVAGLALALFQGPQQLDAPGQAVAAGGAESAGLAGEELFHVAQQADHVDALVHRHGQAGAHAGADLGDAGGEHGRIQVLWQQETGAGAAGLPAFELEAVAHAAGIVLEQLAGRDAERQLPEAGVLHLAGKAH